MLRYSPRPEWDFPEACLGECNVCLTGWPQPVLNKERLRIASPVFKLLLCRCDEAGDASRLGNNEIKPMQQIGLNSVTKNRTPY